jgi:protocatechuate 4,5-dioxygenase beta chain
MAQLVEIIGITHNPFLGRMMANPGNDPVMAEIATDYALMRTRLAESKPDVIVTIASDHLNQWFMDNMPAFLVGKAPRAKGPFPHEREVFGLTAYEAPVNVELARYFVAEGFGQGVDFAFSDEFLIDHAFTVPLTFVRPEQDIPIVPVWTNVMAPPLPPADRFYTVGEALRALIEAAPMPLRVAVVSSGHFAVEVGGPKPFTGSPDETFDRRMMELIAAGQAQTVVREATVDRLMQAGNVTPGFLNYVLLLGLAGGVAPRATALRFPAATAAAYYMEWMLEGAAR